MHYIRRSSEVSFSSMAELQTEGTDAQVFPALKLKKSLYNHNAFMICEVNKIRLYNLINRQCWTSKDQA